MVYNPFEVLRKSEGMCREIYGILEKNAEHPEKAFWFQDRYRPDIIVICMFAIGSCALKDLFAAGYHLTCFGHEYSYVEIWLSKMD